MRILIILHQFYPEFCGGTERVALNLAKAAQRAGHYVHVLACTVNPAVSSTRPCGQLAGALETVHEGVPVTLLPRALLPAAADFSFETDPALVGRLIAWIEHSRFDCAHVLHPMRMGSALLAAQRSGLPYLLTLTDFFSPCFRINLVDTPGRLLPRTSGRHALRRCLRHRPLDQREPPRSLPPGARHTRRSRRPHMPIGVCRRSLSQRLSRSRILDGPARHRPAGISGLQRISGIPTGDWTYAWFHRLRGAAEGAGHASARVRAGAWLITQASHRRRLLW